MLDQFELYFTPEQDYLRLEAMDLFEKCLTEGKPDQLVSFIEAQIVLDPPRLDLLQQIAEDLHQRLLALREHHFEMRDRVMQTIQADFQVDLSEVTTPIALECYHLPEVDELIDYIVFQNPRLSSQKMALLRNMLETSRGLTVQLRNDVHMTEDLFVCLMDWIDALTVAEVHRYWGSCGEQCVSPHVH